MNIKVKTQPALHIMEQGNKNVTAKESHSYHSRTRKHMLSYPQLSSSLFLPPPPLNIYSYITLQNILTWKSGMKQDINKHFTFKGQFQEKMSRQGITPYYQCISSGEERLLQMKRMGWHGSWKEN